MGYARFLLLDFIGVLISVPASIWLGKIFGGSMDELQKQTKVLHLVLGFAVAAMAILMIWRTWKRSRDRREALAKAAHSPAPPGVPSSLDDVDPGDPPGT